MKIISGGQTGADRGGLDAAIELGIEHGGWCPKGRKAEDGMIPDRYCLVETRGYGYKHRTELNVRDADATVIFTADRNVTGGSLLTMRCCTKYSKPCLLLNAFMPPALAIDELRLFLQKHKPKVINIAGNRESKAFGIEKAVKNIIVSTFKE